MDVAENLEPPDLQNANAFKNLLCYARVPLIRTSLAFYSVKTACFDPTRSIGRLPYNSLFCAHFSIFDLIR